MRIGELAAATGVTEKTIRYYEGIGVLEEPRRTHSGYRDYERSAVDKLRFIKAAQAVGLKLGEIREVIALRDRGEVPCGHVVDLIRRRSAEIDAQISELERVRADLNRLARRARALDPKDCRPDKVCHVIDVRHAVGTYRRSPSR